LYAESLSNQHKIIYIDITFVYGKVSLFCSLVFLHMCEWKVLKTSIKCVLFRAKVDTAVTRLSHHNSVCLSVYPSVTRVDQSKTVQARIIKYLPSLLGRL